jgi:hypothetical protein
VIGFNLPFDLTRLAIDHSTARSHGRDTSMRGGFTLRLSKNPSWPHIQIKRINPRAAFIRCVIPQGNHPEARNRRRGGNAASHRGHFIDVSTLAGALVGGKPKLEKLAELLNTRTRKTRGDHWAPITVEYLHYACNDVQVTWECNQKLRDRYAGYGLTDTPIFDIYSAASVGKAHLRQLGVQGWRRVQPDGPDWLIATIMETYYGGRTETRIRRHPVPVVSTDLTSQYPTGYVLMQLWPFQIAESIEWEDEDPAVAAQQLDDITPDQLLDPAFWVQLHRLVLIQPDDDLLPTRAAFTGKGIYNVALARRRGGPAQWYTYADAVASTIATGDSPRILKVLRFRPGPPQDGLHPIALTGDPAYTIDPYRQDFIRAAVELRAQLKTQMREASARGDRDAERRLDAAQQVLKTTTSAVGYGIGIETNPVDHRTNNPSPCTNQTATATRPNRVAPRIPATTSTP